MLSNVIPVILRKHKPTVIINETSLPDGTVGTAYSQQLTVSNGIAPYNYVLYSGITPTGITPSSSGLISGTPTAVGTFIFAIQVYDAAATYDIQYFTVNIAAAVAFSPVDTFTGGRKGVFYNFTDKTKLYQNTAGTTAVTASGQLIGRVLDQSPNAIHATFASGAELTYTESTTNYASSNGTKHGVSLSNIDLSGTNIITIILGAIIDTHAAADKTTVLSLGTSSATKLMVAHHNTDNGWAIDVDNGWSVAGSLPAPQTDVLTVILDRSQANITNTFVTFRLNGANATHTPAGTDPTGNFISSLLQIGAQWDTGWPFFGKLYAIYIIDKQLNTTDRDNVEAYITTLMGTGGGGGGGSSIPWTGANSEITYTNSSATNAFIANDPFSVYKNGTLTSTSLGGVSRIHDLGGNAPLINPATGHSDASVVQCWNTTYGSVNGNGEPNNIDWYDTELQSSTNWTHINNCIAKTTYGSDNVTMLKYNVGDGISYEKCRTKLGAFHIPPRCHIRWELEVAFGKVDGTNDWPSLPYSHWGKAKKFTPTNATGNWATGDRIYVGSNWASATIRGVIDGINGNYAPATGSGNATLVYHLLPPYGAFTGGAQTVKNNDNTGTFTNAGTITADALDIIDNAAEPMLFWQVRSDSQGRPSLAGYLETDDSNSAKLMLSLGVIVQTGGSPVNLSVGTARGLSPNTMIQITIDTFIDERNTSAGGKGLTRFWVNGTLIGEYTGANIPTGTNLHGWSIENYLWNNAWPAFYNHTAYYKTARMLVYP